MWSDHSYTVFLSGTALRMIGKCCNFHEFGYFYSLVGRNFKLRTATFPYYYIMDCG